MLPDTKPRTPADLEPLDLLQAPCWVFDFDGGVKWWANRSGLRLWGVASNADMHARNPVPEMSATTRLRLDALRERLASGEVPVERWTFYPTGLPTFVATCTMSGLVIAEAEGAAPRFAMLVEARPLQTDDVEPFVRRGVEALRYLGEMISLYTRAGTPLMRNPAAVHALGDVAEAQGDAFAATFVDPADAHAIRARLAGGPTRVDVRVQTKFGAAWHALEARESLDPITGELGVLVNQRDISEQIAGREALEASRRRLAQQAEQLRRLTVTPLRVWAGVLALPLIGQLDAARIDAALELLALAQYADLRVVVIDLTGTERIDEVGCAGLRRLVGTLRLRGIAARIVGVRPAIAQSLVAARLELGSVPIHATLADALAQLVAR